MKQASFRIMHIEGGASPRKSNPYLGSLNLSSRSVYLELFQRTKRFIDSYLLESSPLATRYTYLRSANEYQKRQLRRIRENDKSIEDKMGHDR